MSADETLTLFRRLCIDTGGEAARFAAALAREPDGFRRARILPVDGAGPNGSYPAEVNFVDAGDRASSFPASLPTGVCGVLTTTVEAIDHAALAASLATALSLPAGTTREAQPRGDPAALTEWIAATSAGRIGYSLVTRTSPDGRTGISLGVRTFRSNQ